MNWPQLRAVLWLRWRLTRNQWRRSGGLGGVIALAVAAVGFGFAAFGFAGAVALGAWGLRQADADTMTLVWLVAAGAYIVFAIAGLVAEIQRHESLDLQRLMHLPVALGQLFVVNYLASIASLSTIVLVPAMTGLAVGLAISRGSSMLLLAPLAWSLVFMVTAWLYCLRGWLAAMMSNPRRRRAILMALPIVMVALFQLPNLYFNVFNRENREQRRAIRSLPEEERAKARAERDAAGDAAFQRFVAVQPFVPPLWLPYGARRLAEGQALPALAGLIGGVLIGAIGLRRAYRSTLRMYQGETGAKAARAAGALGSAAARVPATSGAVRRSLVDRRLPLVPDAASAVAVGTWQSMRRAPEVKMALGMGFVMTIVLGAWFLSSGAARVPEAARPFVATAAAAFALFMLSQFLANQFGYDREGFRAFVLSPMDRRWILVGKNLATAVTGGTLGLVLVAMVAVWLALPPAGILAALVQLLAVLLLGCLGGNLLSILVPFRIEPGSVKPTKIPGLARIAIVMAQMLLPLVLTPVFLAPLAELLWRRSGWAGAATANLVASCVVFAIAAAAYWYALGPVGRLLERREIAIMQAVTAEQE